MQPGQQEGGKAGQQDTMQIVWLADKATGEQAGRLPEDKENGKGDQQNRRQPAKRTHRS